MTDHSCMGVDCKKRELRLMFYNIYGYKWYPDFANSPHLHSGPVSLRQKMEMRLIERYCPDVLGMQEYNATFNEGMTPLLEAAGYTRVEEWHLAPDKKGRRINFTPLFYRAERLKLLDHGYLLYNGPNDVNSKSLTWGVFEEYGTANRFICICTHFMFNDPKLAKGEPNAVRVENAKQLLAFVDQLQNSAYAGLPVIIGGDLNCFCDSDPFRTLLDGGFAWLYDIAKIKNDSSGIKGYAIYDETREEYLTCPMPKENPHGAIDHVLLKQGTHTLATVEAYLAILDREACLSSDHCPRIADITLA